MIDSDNENVQDQLSKRYDDPLKNKLFKLYNHKLEKIGKQCSEKLTDNFKEYEDRIVSSYEKFKSEYEQYGKEWYPLEKELIKERDEHMRYLENEYDLETSYELEDIEKIDKVFQVNLRKLRALDYYYYQASLQLYDKKISSYAQEVKVHSVFQDIVHKYLDEKRNLMRPYKSDMIQVLKDAIVEEQMMFQELIQKLQNIEELYMKESKEVTDKYNKKLKDLVENDQKFKIQVRKKIDDAKVEISKKFHMKETKILKDMENELKNLATKFIENENSPKEKDDPGYDISRTNVEKILFTLSTMIQDSFDLSSRIPNALLIPDLIQQLDDFNFENPGLRRVDTTFELNSLFLQMMVIVRKSNPILENPLTHTLKFDCRKMSPITSIIENCEELRKTFQLLSYEQKENLLLLL